MDTANNIGYTTCPLFWFEVKLIILIEMSKIVIDEICIRYVILCDFNEVIQVINKIKLNIKKMLILIS